MKKKIISLLISLSIIASMTAVGFATDHDNPKSAQIVLPSIEKDLE